MSNFITKIKVNHILHLKDFCIPISDTEKKHLIITGKNGSGKTILLNEVVNYLSRAGHGGDKAPHNSIDISFFDINSLPKEVRDSGFVLAFYADERKSRFVQSPNPVKPELGGNGSLRANKVDQFLNFMVDCKVQEALMRNEGQVEEADYIRQWFDSFRDILRLIFDDKELELIFNYKDYSFLIQSGDKSFKFTQLSAGYSAVLDIVSDLIIKMQARNNIVRAYEREGIVLIDEIETHLHLELQRVILPMLATIFPNIQFIVTTHSPFILNSLENAVAFDLERREPIEDLTDYSYEALTEGYFGVRTESSEIQMRLQRMEELIHTEQLSVTDKCELEMYLDDFDKIPEAVAPAIKAKYYELKREWLNKH